MNDDLNIAPLSESAARRVTDRINLLLTSMTETVEKVIVLIAEAQAGEAWRALGYDSWPAYVVGEFGNALAGLEVSLRRPVVNELVNTGMSMRAVAQVVGTSVGTVHSDVTQAGVQRLNTSTTGLDGRTYRRPSTEVANPSTPAPRPARRRPLPDAYRDAVWDLRKAVDRLERLHRDDRFPANREALANHEFMLGEVVQRVDKLGSQVRGGGSR